MEKYNLIAVATPLNELEGFNLINFTSDYDKEIWMRKNDSDSDKVQVLNINIIDDMYEEARLSMLIQKLRKDYLKSLKYNI